ncbi:twin-arginine translocation pathway signal protein [Arenibacter aquaticus]|uniref:Twin-arginine translocation pathway signal protein n=1 Tax=Arenibacter aquaticus TaxID=2489054 RepID=A0A430JZN2_9FLAO|nr:alkaline phosphatase D family protein [Arenibacter aquaticus]RTE52379.1 twin-arginine translocation pathway signal protein [Arenibacter aquaticus]
MNRRKYIKTIALGSLLPTFSSYAFPFGVNNASKQLEKTNFKSNWHHWPDMKWVGPEYWGNRLQDWQLKNGMAVCKVTAKNRTLQLLTVQKTEQLSELEVGVEIALQTTSINPTDKVCLGMRLGCKGPFDDYRSAAVFGKGLDIGLTANGSLQIGERIYETALKEIPGSFKLVVHLLPKNDAYVLSVTIKDPETHQVLHHQKDIDTSNATVMGNFALLADATIDKSMSNQSFAAFSNWAIISEKLIQHKEQLFGPICFAQYTLHDKKLKLTAQLAPIEEISGHSVHLQCKEEGSWKTKSTTELKHIGRAVNFELENWNAQSDVPYRILVEIPLKNETHHYTYEGTIAKEPMDKEMVSAAVFSCNFHYGFPDNDIHRNVTKLNPDIMLFLGDQFYEATGGFGAARNASLDDLCLDYLRKWMMFGWSYRELFRHKPCAIIPDDHDVYHGNVWGESGKKADTSTGYGMLAQDSGGYKMPPEWVNMVQFTQTSHLPDPYDPTPVKQDIGVYYTHWNYAGISFAILEDRKFKSAPKHVLPPEAQVRNGWIQNKDFDIKKHRDHDAVLLGKRQHDFIDDWTQDWNNGAALKVVLSQTNFATVATLPKTAMNDDVVPSLPIPKKGEYVVGDVPTVDMDSNGWPANERDRAVKALRKCFAFHIAGDQHLGSFIQYGVEEHGDSGYAFAGPALNNIWPRRFWPEVDASQHTYENPAYVGDHEDGFGNKISVHAVGNPFDTALEPAIIHNRATGYGLVTFNKSERTITTACWPRYSDPTKGLKEQFPGWPITVKQMDNYGRKAVAWLPTIKVENGLKPVISVFDKQQQLVYTVRMPTDTFAPKVFSKGQYTIVIQDLENNRKKTIKHIKAKTKNTKVLDVDFE